MPLREKRSVKGSIFETPNLISGDFTALKSGLSSAGTCVNVLWGAFSFGGIASAFLTKRLSCRIAFSEKCRPSRTFGD
jgi:hypothetical protein